LNYSCNCIIKFSFPLAQALDRTGQENTGEGRRAQERTGEASGEGAVPECNDTQGGVGHCRENTKLTNKSLLCPCTARFSNDRFRLVSRWMTTRAAQQHGTIIAAGLTAVLY
jgi:hypothetical protein